MAEAQTVEIPSPASLVTQTIDVTTLHNTLQSLAGHLTSIYKEMQDLRDDNAKLHEEVSECTRKSEVSQNQYGALFEVVTNYASQLKAIQDDFMGRKELETRFTQVQQVMDQQKFFMEELDNRKIDTHSTLLENRVRETSEESCSRFMMRYERESKDWTMGQILVADNKITKHADELVATTRKALEDDARRIDGKLDDLVKHVGASDKDVEAKFHMILSVEKGVMSKLECHEKHLDQNEHNFQHSCDRIFTNFRLFLHAMGLEFSDIFKLYPDRSVIEEDERDIEEAFQRDIDKANRAQDFIRGWKQVKTANQKLLPPNMANLPDDEGILERRRIDTAHEERLKDLDRRAKLRKAKQQHQTQQSQATSTVPESSRVLLAAPVFTHFKSSVQNHVLQHLSSMKDELATDFSTQLQGFNRELRQKIGTGRAVELIEQYSAKQVTLMLEGVETKLEAVSREAITHDEVNLALSGKVDENKLIHKADVTALQAMEESIQTRISEVVEAATTKLKAQLDGRLKDTASMKWDKHDSRLLNALSLIESGNFSGGSQSAVQITGKKGSGKKQPDSCLSCNRPLSSGTLKSGGSSAAGSPVGDDRMQGNYTPSPRQMAADTFQQQRSEELLAVQGLLSSSAKSKADTTKAADQLNRFELKEWVDNVDRKHRPQSARVKPPHPPRD